MTDHAHELRRYARKIGYPAGDVPSVMLAAADKISDLTINVEYLGNLKKSYEELIGELQEERDALQAKVEAMEKQEPVAWTTQLALELGSSALGFDACRGNLWGDKGIPLYALPGAQPAPSARITALYPVISLLRNGCDPMKAAVELEMLAAAPEVKS